MPLTFLSLGSGSCGNCYYLATEEDAIVIDCGIGIRRFKKYFQEYGLKLSKVRAMLITHDHADHIKAAGKVSSEYNFPVYATELVHEGMDHNYQATVKVSEENRKTIEKDKPFQIGPFNITAFYLPHDARENVGYCIEIGNYVFTVMTDVGAVTENVNKYLSKSTHVIFEANYDKEMLEQGRYPRELKERIKSGNGHLSNAQSAEALAKNLHPELKEVWLCHLSEENNHPELARKTVEAHLRSYGIVAGVDLKLEVLRRRIPTGPYDL